LFQDYDWADEVLHDAHWPRRYLKEFKNPHDAIRYGDECWARVLMNGRLAPERLTQHRNTGGRSFTAKPASTGASSPIKSLAYSTTLRNGPRRLKELTGSA